MWVGPDQDTKGLGLQSKGHLDILVLQHRHEKILVHPVFASVALQGP